MHREVPVSECGITPIAVLPAAKGAAPKGVRKRMYSRKPNRNNKLGRAFKLPDGLAKPSLKAIRGKPRASPRLRDDKRQPLTSWQACQRKQGANHVETDIEARVKHSSSPSVNGICNALLQLGSPQPLRGLGFPLHFAELFFRQKTLSLFLVS